MNPTKWQTTRALNVLWWLHLERSKQRPGPRPRRWRPSVELLASVTYWKLMDRDCCGDKAASLIMAWKEFNEKLRSINETKPDDDRRGNTGITQTP